MQTGNLCLLSSFCGHCYACHSLLSVYTQHYGHFSHAGRKKKKKEKKLIIGRAYLKICNNALFDKASRVDMRAIKEKQLFIPSFISSFMILLGVYLYSISVRKRQADTLEIALT